MKQPLKVILTCSALVLPILAWAFVASAAQAAETMPGAPAGKLGSGGALKGGELVDDPAAFQGKATTARGDRASLLQLDTPAESGTATVD